MKKIILAFTILITAYSQSAYAITLNVEASELNGLLQFMLQTERNPHNSKLYNMYSESKYNTPEAAQKLSQWQQLAKYNAIEFEGLPDTRHNAQMVESLIFIQSVNCSSVNELVKRCSGFFTQSDLQLFKEVLTYFEPVYHELVWKPNEAKISSELERVRTYVQSKNIEAMFNKAAKLYGTNWQNEMPFYVMINPIPPGQVKSTSARPMGNILVADLLLGEEDLDGWLGVVLHEMCHVLYRNQNAEKQNWLEKMFATSTAVNYRNATYNWFDETMATAIGNGYMVEQLTGKPDAEGEWYNNTYINAFAHAVYPVVSKYLVTGKEMDSAFVAACIQDFSKTFTDINNQTEHLFTYVDIVSDTISHEIYNAIYAHYQPRNMQARTPFTTANIDEANGSILTKLIIVKPGDKKALNILKNIPALKELDAKKGNRIFYALGQNGKNYVVMVIDNYTLAGKAMRLLADQKTLKGSSGVLEIK